MTNTNEELGKRIEQLVAEHIAATLKVAKEAVERALAASDVAPVVAVDRPVRTRAGVTGKRRGTAELTALGERFYRALCNKPGEMMAALAADVGATPRELHRAVAGLKQAGRVRAVGQHRLPTSASSSRDPSVPGTELAFELRDPLISPVLWHDPAHRRSAPRWKASRDNGTNWITYATMPAGSRIPVR